MCGFFGELVHTPADPPGWSPESLTATLRWLEHRGPDAEGRLEVRGPGWAARFAHARLKIIDLSEGGAQPMASEDGRHVLVFNGEIYNYRALREELRREGHSFRSESDTEVLLRALRAWGERAIRALDGMFSFVLLDRETGSLLAARDPFGIKPLYWSATPGGIALASEIRCLARALRRPPEVDPDGVASYLAYGSVYGPGTILKDIRELPPGHVLRASASGIETSRWYSVPTVAGRAPVSREDAARVIHDLLSDSVKRQLVSDVPVGVFLSGGMDSSAIVALASRTHGRAIATVTVAFDQQNTEFSEEERAREFAEAQGVRHEVVRLEERWILESLERVVGDMDQPTMDGVNTWAVSQAVKTHGITVALSGLGGDEVFGGYRHVRAAYEHRVAYSVIRKLGGVAAGVGALLGALPADGHSLRKTAALFQEAPHPGGTYAARRALFIPAFSGDLVTEEIAAAWKRRGLVGMLGFPAPTGLPPAQEMSVLEFENYLPFTLLRDTDVMSMAHALEVRVPFLDRALVDFVMTLPLDLRFHDGRQKPLLAAAVPEIALGGVTPKQGFTLPFEKWLKGPMRSEVEARLGALDHAGAWVRPDAATRLLRRFLGGDRRLWTRVWAIYVLDRWLESVARSAGN